jgi:hypothetical protein
MGETLTSALKELYSFTCMYCIAKEKKVKHSLFKCQFQETFRKTAIKSKERNDKYKNRNQENNKHI